MPADADIQAPINPVSRPATIGQAAPGSPILVSVIIQTYREEQAIADVVREVRAELMAQAFAPELIVIDDGSDGRTGELAREAGATLCWRDLCSELPPIIDHIATLRRATPAGAQNTCDATTTGLGTLGMTTGWHPSCPKPDRDSCQIQTDVLSR
jgi:hypothetical protein